MRKLPLIDSLENTFYQLGLSLENSLIISVQHLCSTTEVLFEEFFKYQLDKKNLYVIGKCYSTDPRVLARLQKIGVNAVPSSSAFNCLVPFDLDFDRNIDEMLEEVITSRDISSYERIILLDDGGHLLEKVINFFPDNLPLIGIEQTSSGFNRLKDKDIFFPVINLARSHAKLKFESPIIIDLVVKRLEKKISKLEHIIQKILLIGHGVLGQEIQNRLKTTYEITIFDSEPQKSMISPDDFRTALSEFDLIIGCTGGTSLTFNDFQLLKNPVVLASVSSSDREFEAFKFRRLQPNEDCHADISLDGISLLNSGFPITFDGDHDNIDSDDFQLTRALILAAVYQASVTDIKLAGFIPMRDDLQSIVTKKFEKLKKPVHHAQRLSKSLQGQIKSNIRDVVFDQTSLKVLKEGKEGDAIAGTTKYS